MSVISGFIPMPKIESVIPLSDHIVRITWSASLRPNKVEDIDLSSLIFSFKFYAPLRKNKKLFRTVHVAQGGNAIAWGQNSELDMAATSVERLAEEAMSQSDFRSFLASNKLTQERAAIALGRSRAQIANYVSGKSPIPRVVVLACYGYLFRRQQSVGGIRGGSNVSLHKPETASAPAAVYLTTAA